VQLKFAQDENPTRLHLVERSGVGRADASILGAALVLIGLSLLMVFSTTAITAEQLGLEPTYYLKRHLAHVLVGLLLIAGLLRLRREHLLQAAPIIFLGAILLLLLLAVPGVGRSAGGATRWIMLGPISFQPGELIKIALVLYFSSYVARNEFRLKNFRVGLAMPLLIVGAVCGLLLMQPDFGSSVVILLVMASLLLYAGVPLGRLLLVGVFAGGAGVALIASSPYRLRRVQAFLDPFEDSSGSGYQLIQSLIAVGSGGLSGLGLGASEQKLFYLPAAHTDFIFAVIAEELGLIGASAIVFVYLFIAYRGFRLAFKLQDQLFFGALALGSTLLIIVPALLNVGVVIGLLPTKGLVLPLLSYGGSATVMSCALIGILLLLSREESS